MPASVSRAMVEPTAFTMPRASAPLSLASRRAASVSAVSPDWLMAMTTVPSSMIGIAIAELAGVLDFGGNLGQVLHQIFADEARVPRRAAAGEDDRAAPAPGRVRNSASPPRMTRPSCRSMPAAQAVLDRRRLLEDLLEHEVLVLAQLHLFELEFRFLDLRGDRHVVDGHGLEAAAAVMTAISLSLR